MNDVELTLCVLLWAREGQAAALVEYEDQVLQLISEHGGTVLQRARTTGTDGDPLEIQFFFLSVAGCPRCVPEGRAANRACRDPGSSGGADPDNAGGSGLMVGF